MCVELVKSTETQLRRHYAGFRGRPKVQMSDPHFRRKVDASCVSRFGLLTQVILS